MTSADGMVHLGYDTTLNQYEASGSTVPQQHAIMYCIGQGPRRAFQCSAVYRIPWRPGLGWRHRVEIVDPTTFASGIPM